MIQAKNNKLVRKASDLGMARKIVKPESWSCQDEIDPAIFRFRSMSIDPDMHPWLTWCIRYLRDDNLNYTRYSSDQVLFMRTLRDTCSINTLVICRIKYKYELCNQRIIDLFVMAHFSKFLTRQLGSWQLLDTEGHTYNLRKERTTTW